MAGIRTHSLVITPEILNRIAEIDEFKCARPTGASRNTIKNYLKSLIRADHIARHGAGRGKWYGLI